MWSGYKVHISKLGTVVVGDRPCVCERFTVELLLFTLRCRKNTNYHIRPDKA